MLENITGNTIATEIEMTKSAFNGSILIIEGNNDIKFYKKFIDENMCHVVVSHGKKNALDSIEILNAENIDGVIAIVDSDFWKIEGIPDLPNNIFYTDSHDSESMIFSSDAFDRIVNEYCTEHKISKIENIRYFIYESARPIGYLRLASHKNELGLSFNEINYKKVTDRNTITVNIDSLINHILHLTETNLKKR